MEITADESGKPYDYTRNCGLCAMPAFRGKDAIYTFIVDMRGAVYMKDNGGKPVTIWPDVRRDGWKRLK